MKSWIFGNNRDQVVARTDYIETVNHAESIFLSYSMLKNPTTETSKLKNGTDWIFTKEILIEWWNNNRKSIRVIN